MKRTTVAVWLEKYNRWQIKVQKDGERRTFTCSTPGRTGQRMCHAKADAWLDDNVVDTNVRVERLFEDYLSTKKETTSISNWKKIESLANNWILPKIGKIKIENLTEQHLQNVIDKAYASGLSKKTISCIKETVLNFLKYCRRRKATRLFPEELTIPMGARKAEKQILQPDHMRTLFTSDITQWRGKKVFDPLIYAYRFQVLTGLRPGELLALEWQDIHGNEVRIARSINDYNQITTGKNENAVRHFILSETAADILRRQRQLSDTPRVFGDVIQQTYRKSFRRYCTANGIPETTPYELRHTFVSIAKNLSAGQVKAIVGHSQNMDTFGIYGHEVNGELQQTAQQIDELFTEIIRAQ